MNPNYNYYGVQFACNLILPLKSLASAAFPCALDHYSTSNQMQNASAQSVFNSVVWFFSKCVCNEYHCHLMGLHIVPPHCTILSRAHNFQLFWGSVFCCCCCEVSVLESVPQNETLGAVVDVARQFARSEKRVSSSQPQFTLQVCVLWYLYYDWLGRLLI